MSTAVFLKNIPFSSQYWDVQEHFKKHGFDTAYVHVFMGADGKSKGSAIVTMKSAEEAANAIEAISGTWMGNLRVSCREDKPPKKKQKTSEHEDSSLNTKSTELVTTCAAESKLVASNALVGTPVPSQPSYIPEIPLGDCVVDVTGPWVFRKSSSRKQWYLVAPNGESIWASALKASMDKLPSE